MTQMDSINSRKKRKNPANERFSAGLDSMQTTVSSPSPSSNSTVNYNHSSSESSNASQGHDGPSSSGGRGSKRAAEAFLDTNERSTSPSGVPKTPKAKPGVKKRNRAILSCRQCRVKKLKCDRGQPCSSCVKTNLGHLCTYKYENDHESESSVLSSAYSPGMQQELNSLRMKIKELEDREAARKIAKLRETKIYLEGDKSDLLIGINPICSSKDVVNINDNLTKMGRSKASFFFPKPMRQDPGINLFWLLNVHPVVKRSNFSALLQVTSLDPNTNLHGTNRVLEKMKAYFKDNFIPHPAHSSMTNSPEVRRQISAYGKSMGHVFSDTYTETDTIVVSLQKVLPSKLVINHAIDRFFQKLYCFFPVVDERAIKAEFTKIFQFSPSGFLESIKVNQQQDIANLIIILIIIRLSYLSIFRNIGSKNEEILSATTDNNASLSDSFLVKNPIPTDVIDIVDRCLKELNCTRRQSFDVLQAYLMRRIYRKYAPEEGDGPQSWDGQAYNGLLINMAIAVGIHRDPDYYHDVTLSERCKALRRKVWYYLVHLDIIQALSYSYTLCVRKSDYDTLLPMTKSEASNIDDFDLEKKVIQSFALRNAILEPMHDLASQVSEFEGKVKITEVLSKVSDLETMILKTLGTASDYTTSRKGKQNFYKIFKFELYIYSKYFISFIYQYLVLFYEKEDDNNFMFFFLKKLFTLFLLELNPVNEELIYRCDDFFDDSFTLILTPVISLLQHTIMYEAISFTIRLRSTLKTLELKPNFEQDLQSNSTHQEYIHCLRNLCDLNAQVMKQLAKMIQLGAQRYFTSWKSKKVHLYGVALVADDQSYEVNPKLTEQAGLKLTINNIKELETIIEQYFHRLESSMSSARVVSFPVTDVDRDCLKAINVNSLALEEIDERTMESLQSDHFWIHISKNHQDPDAISSSFKSELEQSTPTSIDLPQTFGGNLLYEYFDMFGSDWTGDAVFDDLNQAL